MTGDGEPHTLAPVYGTTETERNLLDPTIWDRFSSLDQSGKICAEYVWIGGTGKTQCTDASSRLPN